MALYFDRDKLQLGDVRRYQITYTPPAKQETPELLYLRLKNTELAPVRAVHLISGPFTFYCHVVPANYNHKNPFYQEEKEVRFKYQIKPGKLFNVKLFLNDNSRIETDFGIAYQWDLDIISMIIVSKRPTVGYDLAIGPVYEDLKELTGLSDAEPMVQNGQPNKERDQAKEEPSRDEKEPKDQNGGSSKESEDEPSQDQELNENNPDDAGTVVDNGSIVVTKQVTEDLWNAPPARKEDVHLVILTHGIFSNVLGDMLYLRDQIVIGASENVMVRGYEGNRGKTERGVKRQGMGVGAYVLELLDQHPHVNKLLFVGHLLGGLVQLYAIKYILLLRGPDYFEKRNIKLQNLVCMALPLLGILTEMSFIISWFLDLGTLGKTGRDLTLTKRMPRIFGAEHDPKLTRPFLEILPDDPLASCLAKFAHRTVYANAVNDGIVPLRTLAILYLDYRALGDVTKIKEKKEIDNEAENQLGRIPTNEDSEDVGQVPYENNTKSPGAVGDHVIDNDYGEVPDDDDDDSRSPFRHQREDSPASDSAGSLTPSKTSFFSSNKPLKRDLRMMAISGKGLDPNATLDLDLTLDVDFRLDDTESEMEYNLPPRALSVELAINTLINPVPLVEFVTDPSLREPCIFHDKYYHFKKTPQVPEGAEKPMILKRVFANKDWKLKKQVKIALKYHANGLTWRKVLVNLPPDAHNNIVCRRRFANGYGWGVVDHLVDNFFGPDQAPPPASMLQESLDLPTPGNGSTDPSGLLSLPPKL